MARKNTKLSQEDVSNTSKNVNLVARTHFITMWPKSLENCGIESDIENKLDIVKKQLQDFFDDMGGVHYTAICKSAKGNYHVHDVVTFEKAKRCKTVARYYGKAHVEFMRGTKQQAKAYIEKTGEWEEKGEEILCMWGNPDAIENNSGTRTDLAVFDEEALKPDFDLVSFLLKFNTDREIKLYQNRYRLLMQREQNKKRYRPYLQVIYVQGKPGSGKTYPVINHSKSIFKVQIGKAFPFDGYSGEKAILFDELRPGVFTPYDLFTYLDKYAQNVNVKGGFMPACWNTVFICTATPLQDWYKKNDDYKYTDNLKQQFVRRIDKWYEAKNHIWHKLPLEPYKNFWMAETFEEKKKWAQEYEKVSNEKLDM